MRKLFDLKIVSISHFQSCSGTVFLHSLLDSHPQICSIPGVPNFVSLILSKYKTAEEALKLFEKSNPKFYDTSKMSLADENSAGLHNLGESIDEGIITNRETFHKYFFDHIDGEEITPSNIIISLNFAFSCTHNINTSEFRIILLHPHEPPIAFLYENIFPNSIHLLPIRDPMRAYCSQIKLSKERAEIRNRPYSPRGQLLAIASNLYEYYRRNMNVCLFRIEDLEPEKKENILNSICFKLNINYHQSLNKSTFLSKPYWGANPSAKTKVFDITRHTKPIALKKYEMNLFAVINKQFNEVTGYPCKELSTLETFLSPIWLLLPLQEELQWFYNALIKRKYKGLKYSSGKTFYFIKPFLGLMTERIFLFKMFIRNVHSDHYSKIRKSLLLP